MSDIENKKDDGGYVQSFDKPLPEMDNQLTM